MTLRVLLQPRPNTFTHRGGDTVVLERLAAELASLGVSVTVDAEGRETPSRFDVVHLFNFALPDLLRLQAERCVATGTPFVVTSLYEDWPRFFNQMQLFFRAAEAYVAAGQPHDRWSELVHAARSVPPCDALDNRFVAERAARILTTGAEESAAIERLYAGARTSVVPLGCDLTGDATADLFRKETGLSDFVLSVGRLECRKNQLALLKALEESELTLVLATGGFTYQADYEKCCRAFRRKGRVVFLGRLAEPLLKSMYAAARVHALPSWYELPGLVTLEALAAGASVVASDRGTTRDYCGDLAFYAEPDDTQAIRNAVIAAYYGPSKAEAREVALGFTWARSAAATAAVYREIVGG